MNLENLKNKLDVAFNNINYPKDVKIFLNAEDVNGNPVNIEVKSINWGNNIVPTLVMTTEEKLVVKDKSIVGKKQMIYIENIIAYCMLKLYCSRVHIDTVWNMYCWLKENVNRHINRYEIKKYENKEEILDFLRNVHPHFMLDENTNLITTNLNNSLLAKTFGLDTNFENKISVYIDVRKARLLQNSVFYKNILAHLMEIIQVKVVHYQKVVDAYQFIVDNLPNYYENYFSDVAVSEEEVERTILYSNNFFEYDDKYISLKKDFEETLVEFPLSEELREILKNFVKEKGLME